MNQVEVLVREALAPDRETATAVTTRVVATLDHEVLDDAVELAARVAATLPALGQRNEVLHRLGSRLAVEAERNAAKRLVTLLDIEVNVVRQLRILVRERKGSRGTHERQQRQHTAHIHPHGWIPRGPAWLIRPSAAEGLDSTTRAHSLGHG